MDKEILVNSKVCQFISFSLKSLCAQWLYTGFTAELFSFQFWKLLCKKEDFNRYESLQMDDGARDLGFRGLPLRVDLVGEMPQHKKVFRRGIQMRKNLLAGNFRGWRTFANQNQPLLEIAPDLDQLEVKMKMGDFPKMYANDDIKVDWDEKHLVIFHFLRFVFGFRL